MNVIFNLGKAKKNFRDSVVAIGVFDGLHLGHQLLIRKVVERARALRCLSVVMTFSPHPVHVLRPEIPLPLIVSLPYRLKLIEQLNVQTCFVVRFTKQFSRLSPEQFIHRYIIDCLHAKEVFVGDDFRFGQNRRGTIELFKKFGKKFGFKVFGIHPVLGVGHKISSTDIRNLINEGKLDEAKKYLGRFVSLMGVVKEGNRRGKTLGFPTANIYPAQEVIPPMGVYAVRVIIKDKIYFGMANIGLRPTFSSSKELINVEAHIFDFHKDLYGKEIIIEFIKKIREEKAFLSKEKLIQQLKKDEQHGRSLLRDKKFDY